MVPASATERPRVVVVDDHRMVAESLATSLSKTCEVVAVAGGGADLLEILRRSSADCVLMDFAMPEHNALDLIPRVLSQAPELKIIVVTMVSDPVLAHAVLNAGARGFVPKEAPLAELLVAIDEVLAGGRYLSPRVPKTSHRVGPGAQHLALQRLTPRQQEIVLLFGEGLSPLEVSRALHLSPSAITFHKHNIMRALGIDSDGGLLRYAVLVRAAADAGPGNPPSGAAGVNRRQTLKRFQGYADAS